MHNKLRDVAVAIQLKSCGIDTFRGSWQSGLPDLGSYLGAALETV